VGVGGACSAGGPPCADGYSCVAGTCTSWPGLGQPCAAGTSCLGGGCNVTVTPQLCVTGQPLGAYCVATEQCASWYCNPYTQRCDSPTCVP
jgi:hypothetical protein